VKQTTTTRPYAGAGAASVSAARTIRQRRLGNHLTFELDQNRLIYTDRDYSGEKRFSVDYDAICVLDSSLLAVNHARRFWNLLRLPVLVGLLLAMVVLSGNSRMSWMFALIFVALAAAACAANHLHLFTVRYTVLPLGPRAGQGPIRVIQDRNHAVILREIHARCRGSVQRLHGGMNVVNHLDTEIARFGWRKDKALLGTEEYAADVEELPTYASSVHSAAAGGVLG
jgi:hypothetical protein